MENHRFFLFRALLPVLACLFVPAARGAAAKSAEPASSVTVLSPGAQVVDIGIELTDLANAIYAYWQNRPGGAAIYRHDQDSGALQLTQQSQSGAHKIILFDWSAESGLLQKGYDVSAGDALFTLLVKNDLVHSDYLHFVGHSRGTMANCLAAQRLLYHGYRVDQLTNLDWENGGTVSEGVGDLLAAAGPVLAWDGVGLVDNYYGLGTRISLEGLPECVFVGEPVSGAYDVKFPDPRIAPDYPTMDHLEVYSWYTDTVGAAAATYGYYWAAHPEQQRLAVPTGAPAPVREPESVCNGSFDWGTLRALILAGAVVFSANSSSLPGWTHQGGGGNGYSDNSDVDEFGDWTLQLGWNNASRTHNPMVIPPYAQFLRFGARVDDASADDQLHVRIRDARDGSLLADRTDLVDLRSTGDWVDHALDVSSWKDKVVTLEFALAGGGLIVDSHVRINNVRFEGPTAPRLDLVFCIDTSLAMADGVKALKDGAQAIAEGVARRNPDARVAVVDFRDFPNAPYGAPGDYAVRDVLPFTGGHSAAAAALASLTTAGGGDVPQSVYSALLHCIQGGTLGGWRSGEDVMRAIVLIGNAPPHDPEPFTNYTLADIASAAAPAAAPAPLQADETNRVRVYSIAVGTNAAAAASFQALADATSGAFFQVDAAKDLVGPIAQAVNAMAQPGAISGWVRTPGGAPVAGVALNGLPGAPVTDERGFYRSVFASGWSGLAAPAKPNCAFSPPSRSYANVAGGLGCQSYVLAKAAPSLSSVGESGHGAAQLAWSNDAQPPAQFLGFAWDVYQADWVKRFWQATMWLPFPSSASSGPMDLGFSGAYHVWISSQYADGAWLPCANPWTGIVYGGTPHAPRNVQAADLGSLQARLTWSPEIYGTWHDQIIAWSETAGNWVAVGGPSGQSLWQFVMYPATDFLNGRVDLALPSPGRYDLFLRGVAWDAATAGEYATAAVDVK
ncbi:MAG: hypothetical protein NTW86_29180 [Candidatus Sumerlaeota bacterium]|nr:hypothetical protein [Candidatus Sumerlaeota bacterium]